MTVVDEQTVMPAAKFANHPVCILCPVLIPRGMIQITVHRICRGCDNPYDPEDSEVI